MSTVNIMTTSNIEIRKLRPVELYSLAKILSPDYWKILMGIIKKPNSLNVPMFTSDHIAMIETAAIKQHKLASEIFLDEWSTMGRVRPTVQTTIKLLVEAELFRAADFLAVEVMKGNPPKRPSKGPAAAIEIPDIVNEYNQQANNSNINSHLSPLTATISNCNAGHFSNNDNSTFLHHFNCNVGIHQVFNTNMKNNVIVNELVSSNQESNLMKFSSDIIVEKKLNTVNDNENCIQQSSCLLPNLSALNLKSKNDLKSFKTISPSNSSNFPRELVSSELPLCINNINFMSSYEESLSETGLSLTYSNSSDSYSNTCNNLEKNNSSAITIDFSNSQNDNIEIQISDNISKEATLDAAYDELPLTVLEFCKR